MTKLEKMEEAALFDITIHVFEMLRTLQQCPPGEAVKARTTVRRQYGELKAKIDAAPPAIQEGLGWVTGVGFVETKETE